MKLGRIKALCKARATAILYDTQDGRQHISDGVGIWPVDDKLRLSEDVIRTIFEVPMKKWEENWYWQELNSENADVAVELLEEVWPEDREIKLEARPITIDYFGTQLRRFETEDSYSIWASGAQFTAIEEPERYALRAKGDMRVIAAYKGMLCEGVVQTWSRAYAEKVREEILQMATDRLL